MSDTDYAALAQRYAAHRQPDSEVLARLTSVLTRQSRVLEVGCGTGNYISAIQETVGCSCVGADPSAEMLAQLRARGNVVGVVQTRAEELDGCDGPFELIYSVDVMHHLSDRLAAFQAAFRALGAGGRFCAATDSEWTIRHREPMAEYFPETVEIELSRYPSAATMAAELARAGFESLSGEVVEREYELLDATPFREKVFSVLLLIDREAFQRGLSRLESALARGPMRCTSRYLLLWATKPNRP